MKVQRYVTAAALVVGLTSTFWLSAGVASADTVPFNGSASVEIPASPAGDMGFTLTINGQEHDFSHVDNSLGGTLTLTWVASEREPDATIQGCEAGPGGQIRLDEATPSAKLWAIWVSPTSQETIGPVDLPAREGFAAASVCVPESNDQDPAEQPVEEPAEQDEEDPSSGEEPGTPQDEKQKKEKQKDKPKK
jgi:hypothetical protein